MKNELHIEHNFSKDGIVCRFYHLTKQSDIDYITTILEEEFNARWNHQIIIGEVFQRKFIISGAEIILENRNGQNFLRADEPAYKLELVKIYSNWHLVVRNRKTVNLKI